MAGLALGGMDRVPARYIWALTGQQKQAAYHAGEQDAVELLANEGIDADFAENPGESLDLAQEQPVPMEAGSQGKDGLTPGQTGSILDAGGATEGTNALAIKRVMQAMTAQVASLPEEQKQALREYTGFAAFRINRAISSGKITPEIQQEIDLLDAALKDGVMPETVVLHRDTVLSFLGLGLSDNPTAEELAWIIGRKITNRIFTSASFENLGLPGRNVQLWLTVPAGYRGCQFIQSVAYSKFKDQTEVLFARGLQYRITKAAIENGKYVLYAEVLK